MWPAIRLGAQHNRRRGDADQIMYGLFAKLGAIANRQVVAEVPVWSEVAKGGFNACNTFPLPDAAACLQRKEQASNRVAEVPRVIILQHLSYFWDAC